jgi:hypothetical protein
MEMETHKRQEIPALSQPFESWGEWAKRHYTAEGWEKGWKKGALRACREDVRLVLEERFGPLPEELVQRIEATEDLQRLEACIRQSVHIQSLDELQL